MPAWLARSTAVQEVADSILKSGISFCGNISSYLWLKKGGSRWMAERWALSTGERLGSLSRNSVARGTDRLQNDLNCVDGDVKPQQNKQIIVK